MSERDLLEEISTNEELSKLEHEGFERGRQRGKTMNVPLGEVLFSLDKQWTDFKITWHNYRSGVVDFSVIKRALADLRNVAGCVFLKIQEIEDKKVT